MSPAPHPAPRAGRHRIRPRACALLAAALLALAPRAARTTDPEAARASLHELCIALSASCGPCEAKRRGLVEIPTPAGTPLPARPLDAWGTPVQIAIGGGGLTLRSAGPDRALGTADDLVEQCSRDDAP